MTALRDTFAGLLAGRSFVQSLLAMAALLTGHGGWAQPSSVFPSDGSAALVRQVAQNLPTVKIGSAPQAGGEASLTLMGAVPTGATVQWQRKDARDAAFLNVFETATYRGVAQATLKVAGATVAMNGDQFRCVITDTNGNSVYSEAAALVVGPPTLSILDGNRQITEPGRFNAKPFDLAVWDASGTQPLVDTPVTFTVQSGGGLLSATDTGGSLLATTLTLNTDADGTVKAFYRHLPVDGITSEIKAAAGTRDVTFYSTSLLSGETSPDGSGEGGGALGGSKSASTARRSGGGLSSAESLRAASLAKNGKGGVGGEVMSAAIAAMSLKLRGADAVTPQYYTVTTSDWAISGLGPRN